MEGPLNKTNTVYCIVIHALHLTVFFFLLSSIFAPTHFFLLFFLMCKRMKTGERKTVLAGFCNQALDCYVRKVLTLREMLLNGMPYCRE